jgi:hypothetical protein
MTDRKSTKIQTKVRGIIAERTGPELLGSANNS